MSDISVYEIALALIRDLELWGDTDGTEQARIRNTMMLGYISGVVDLCNEIARTKGADDEVR